MWLLDNLPWQCSRDLLTGQRASQGQALVGSPQTKDWAWWGTRAWTERLCAGHPDGQSLLWSFPLGWLSVRSALQSGTRCPMLLSPFTLSQAIPISLLCTPKAVSGSGGGRICIDTAKLYGTELSWWHEINRFVSSNSQLSLHSFQLQWMGTDSFGLWDSCWKFLDE